jgi:putative transposase
LDDVRARLEAWRVDYNEHRPHSALGHLTPRDFARRRGPTTDAEAA